MTLCPSTRRCTRDAPRGSSSGPPSALACAAPRGSFVSLRRPGALSFHAIPLSNRKRVCSAGGRRAVCSPGCRRRSPEGSRKARARLRLRPVCRHARATQEPPPGVGAHAGLSRRVPLALAGPRGWDFQQILDVAGRRKDVRVLGEVSDEELAALYQSCSVFCYPSLYEGFGLPLLEAMCAGAPCVTSSASSLQKSAGTPWSMSTRPALRRYGGDRASACLGGGTGSLGSPGQRSRYRLFLAPHCGQKPSRRS
jgi:hypothetical protein